MSDKFTRQAHAYFLRAQEIRETAEIVRDKRCREALQRLAGEHDTLAFNIQTAMKKPARKARTA